MLSKFLLVIAAVVAVGWLLHGIAKLLNARRLNEAQQDRQVFDYYADNYDELAGAELEHYHELKRRHGFKDRIDGR